MRRQAIFRVASSVVKQKNGRVFIFSYPGPHFFQILVSKYITRSISVSFLTVKFMQMKKKVRKLPFKT